MEDRPAEKIPWRDRAQYRFDNFMARGGRSIFVTLTLVFLALLVAVLVVRAILMAALPPDAFQNRGGILRDLYISFLEMTDPGSMALDFESSGWVKITTIVAGLAGVVMLSALIAFITTSLDQRLARLRKGHSRVVETGHTLILGWSDQDVVEIIRELIVANESEDDAVVVVLANRDKEYMDDYLAVHVADRRTTRIVTRSGNPAAPANLELVGVGDAKSVVVLSQAIDTDRDVEKASADARVIKSLLGVVSSRPEDVELNIVAEILSPHLHQLARAISPEEITTLDSSEILARILVQTSRSVGLSVVYNEILSFEGAEMYFYSGEWEGKTFGALGPHFLDGVPIGYRSGAEIQLNPEPEHVLERGDDLILVASDDSAIEYLPEPVATAMSGSIPAGRLEKATERELLIGWTPKSPIILAEYAEYVLPGSRIDVMLRSQSEELLAEIREVDERLPQLDVSIIDRDPMDPETWETVDPRVYNNVIILGQANPEHDTDRIDAETIMILILLRKWLGGEAGDGDRRITKLITELVESDNQTLATHAGVHDFVVSSRFISMLLAQVSEQKGMARVYDDLFDETGAEIYLKPASLYFDEFPTSARFVDLMARAQQRGEVCLGFQVKVDESRADRNFGVQLIPPKTQTFELQQGDSLIVLAEDET
jgi:hypothetical protein